MLNTDNNIFFAIKSYLRIQPFMTLLIGVMLIIAIFGITVKIMEFYNSSLIRLIGGDTGNIMMKFSDIYNSYWLIVVTMATSSEYINGSWIWGHLPYDIFRSSFSCNCLSVRYFYSFSPDSVSEQLYTL